MFYFFSKCKQEGERKKDTVENGGDGCGEEAENDGAGAEKKD